MKCWTVRALLVVSLFAAPLPRLTAQQPPLTKDQVLNLVRNQLGDEAGAKAIQQRGIDFVPAEDFLNALRDTGAKDAFIQALRAAAKPKPDSAPPKKPLSQIQIINLLSARISSQRVAALIGQRGIDFDPTEDFEQFLQVFNATEVLGPALRQARVIKSQLDPGALAQQTQIQSHVSRGLNLLRQEKSSEAGKEFQAAVDLDPSKSELRFLLAASLQEENKLEEAITQLREGIRLNPRSELPQHHELGFALERKGDLEGALAEYRESLRVNPDFETAHISIGLVLQRKGDLDGAISEFRAALQDNSANAFAHINLGHALKGKKDLDGAIAEFREAIRLSPQEGFYHANLGEALEARKDLDGAIAEYREFVHLIPNLSFAHQTLGQALKRKGDIEGAIAEFREAVRLQPQYEYFHSDLGNALETKGDLDGAIAEFREVVRLKPDGDLGHYRLGELLEKKGDVGAALAEYKTALTLNPQDSSFQESYERLQQKVRN